MEQINPMRVGTKISERLAGWSLLLPLSIAFWLFTLGLATFFLSAFANTAYRHSFGENLFVVAAVCLVIGMLSFVSYVLSGKLHDALAVYEFNEHGVAKESPFYRQEARWSQVAGWALSINDQTWWLLDAEGRPLLSLEWHLLPSEQIRQAKAFTCKQLLQFLPYAKRIQPGLWQRWGIVGSVGSLLIIGGFLGWYLNRQIEVIAIGATLVLMGSVLFGALYLFSVPARALFIVHGDWLGEPKSGVAVHLPMVWRLIPKPYSMLIVATDGQRLFVPKEFEWLVEYVKERVLQSS